MPDIIRKHLVLSGAVQGVGLRYRTHYLGESLGLSGWVRNLPDGEVEMELEGEDEKIDLLLQQLQQSPYINITFLSAKTVPLSGGYGIEILD